MSSKLTNKSVGRLGEDIALQYLRTAGYVLVAQNYTKPWAEIDIICRKDDTIHFVEVKTVTYETKAALRHAISHETWRPEEQVHARKLQQIRKGVESWLAEHRYTENFTIMVAAVRVVPREKFATVKLIKDVIIE